MSGENAYLLSNAACDEFSTRLISSSEEEKNKKNKQTKKTLNLNHIRPQKVKNSISDIPFSRVNTICGKLALELSQSSVSIFY